MITLLFCAMCVVWSFARSCAVCIHGACLDCDVDGMSLRVEWTQSVSESVVCGLCMRLSCMACVCRRVCVCRVSLCVPPCVSLFYVSRGCRPGDPTWMVVGAVVPWEVAVKTGDVAFAAEHYTTAKALVDFMTRHLDPELGLVCCDNIVVFCCYCSWLAVVVLLPCGVCLGGAGHVARCGAWVPLPPLAGPPVCSAPWCDTRVVQVTWGYYGDWLALEGVPKPQVTGWSHILAVSRVCDLARLAQQHTDADAYTALLARLKTVRTAAACVWARVPCVTLCGWRNICAMRDTMWMAWHVCHA